MVVLYLGVGYYRGRYGGGSKNVGKIIVEILMFSDSAFYADFKNVIILMCLILKF